MLGTKRKLKLKAKNSRRCIGYILTKFIPYQFIYTQNTHREAEIQRGKKEKRWKKEGKKGRRRKEKRGKFADIVRKFVRK